MSDVAPAAESPCFIGMRPLYRRRRLDGMVGPLPAGQSGVVPRPALSDHNIADIHAWLKTLSKDGIVE